jgi:uncharacterized protein YbjT (DUF2867 family)
MALTCVGCCSVSFGVICGRVPLEDGPVILVIGGRSKIGAALIDALAVRNEGVRALVRSSDRKDPFPEGVETVPGDLADRDSLRSAIAGADRVFLLCGPSENEVELNRNAIDVAKDAGVQLLVRSSILGSDPTSSATFVRDHGACDAYLRDSGVPHAIVQPNLFLQNVPENTIPSIDSDGNFYANAGNARISMVDTRDVAEIAAVLLTQPGHASDAYEVTGPEALSYQDIATALSKSTGRTITYIDAPDDAVRRNLLGFGLGKWLVGALVDLYQDYRRSGADGYAAQVTDTVERLTAHQARSLEQLLAEQPHT